MQENCTSKTWAPRQCAKCGATFEPSGPSQRYCPDVCAEVFRRQYQRNYMRRRRGSQLTEEMPPTRIMRPRVIVICELCGITISRYASHAARDSRTFCSTECARKSQIKPKPTNTCVVCGTIFETEAYKIIQGRQLCSRTCQGRYNADRNVLERLHKNTLRLPNGCLIRTHRIHLTGYSLFGWRGKTMGAHKAAFLIANPDAVIPKGWDVCHACPGGDNKACIEPTHLSIKPHAKNIQEASERGSMPWKLTPDSVRAMRQDWNAGGFTWASLGDKYRVTDMTARAAVLRLTWAWVE